jgi:hypothetical protein
MVVQVLMTSCHVSLNPNSGPVIPHTRTTATARRKVAGLPVRRAVATARRPNQSARGGASVEVLPMRRFACIYFGRTLSWFGRQDARHKTAPPLAYRPPLQAQLGRHFLVLSSLRAGQHNAGSQSQRLRRLPPLRQRLKFGTLIIAQYQGRKSLDRHQFLRRCSSTHLWHNHAKLMRFYDCELVTQDTRWPAALRHKHRWPS